MLGPSMSSSSATRPVATRPGKLRRAQLPRAGRGRHRIDHLGNRASTPRGDRQPPPSWPTRAARGRPTGTGARSASRAGAARHLAAAGRRAADERDMETAAALLQRAFDVVPPDAPERLDIAIRLADALSWIDWMEEGLRGPRRGRPPRGDGRRTGPRAVVAPRARLGGRELENAAEALADARRAIASLEEVGDHESLAYAYVSAYQAAVRLSPPSTRSETFTRAIEHVHGRRSPRAEGLATAGSSTSGTDRCRRSRAAAHAGDPGRPGDAIDACGGRSAWARRPTSDGRRSTRARAVAENHAIIEDPGMPQTEAADLIAADAGSRRETSTLPSASSETRSIDRRRSRLTREQAHAAWRPHASSSVRGGDAEARPFVSLANVERAAVSSSAPGWVLEATIAAREGESTRRRSSRADHGDLERFTESGMLVDDHADGGGECVGR